MGRNILVTGGVGGIGQAVCSEFGAKDDYVIAADIDVEKGEPWEESFLKQGYRGKFFPIDLQDVGAIAGLVQEIERQHGGVDVLVNNAGSAGFTPLADLTLEKWDRVIAVNLRSMVFLAKYCSESMKEKRSGRIINISSTRYRMSEPGSEAYAASKGGIVSLTHALAVSFHNTGITVNCISPGWIEHRDYASLSPQDHNQHPAGRVGKPEDIARLCVFLAEPKNDFITGENIIVDGGMTRKMIYYE